ncbi:MAG: prepilin peptidase [Sphingomonas sp.]|uniref:prepilin peptidase n=1 Tax=Sphingomonas sp. TaxID=28214 RepID=UPI001B02BC92|nr:A24 family peptidase [Sphingomonas sp.]MBO9622746.1 prepilin peptidase [Sphingomonas sp.]
MTTEAWLWPILLGVLGLVFGSFIATLAIRWPQERSALKGRSQCDGCGKGLGARELVPVLSYVLQRGRCRACGAAIAPSHLVTELIGGAIGVSAGLVAPGVEGACGAVFGWLLLALAAIDFAAFWLPNALTGALAATGLAVGLLADVPPPLTDRLIGGLAGFGTLWLVAMLYRALRGRHGLGGGDPKMLGGIGPWLGWQALPLVVLGACFVGLAAVLMLILGGRRLHGSSRLPFGVMLAVAAFGVWLAEASTPRFPPGTVIYLVPENQE